MASRTSHHHPQQNGTKPMLLKTTPSTVANSVWSIEDIVDGPKFETVNGKKKKYYKVKWSESYELASNIPQELIEIFEKRGQKAIRILGPIVDSTRQQLAAMDEGDDTNVNGNTTTNGLEEESMTNNGEDDADSGTNEGDDEPMGKDKSGKGQLGKGRKKKNIKKMHFAVEIGDDVVVLDYKSVRSMYRNELLEYFEERAKLDG